MLRSLGADAIVYLLYDRWSLRRKRLAAWRAEVFQWARWDPEILRSTGQPRDGTDGTGWIWWKKCLNYGWIMLNYGWVVAGEMFGLKQSWKVQTSHLYHVSCMSCESCFFFFFGWSMLELDSAELWRFQSFTRDKVPRQRLTPHRFGEIVLVDQS